MYLWKQTRETHGESEILVDGNVGNLHRANVAVLHRVCQAVTHVRYLEINALRGPSACTAGVRQRNRTALVKSVGHGSDPRRHRGSRAMRASPTRRAHKSALLSVDCGRLGAVVCKDL